MKVSLMMPDTIYLTITPYWSPVLTVLVGLNIVFMVYSGVRFFTKLVTG